MQDGEEMMEKHKTRKNKQEIIELSSHHETLEDGWQAQQNEIKPNDSLFDNTNKNSNNGQAEENHHEYENRN